MADYVPRLSSAEFEAVVEQALDLIPRDLAAVIDNVAIGVELEPTAEQRGRATELFGLYEGVPLTERDDGWFGSLPDRITIFQGPLERAYADHAQLRHQIAVTVIHEVGHLFGLDDSRLHELGWG